jgi:ribosome production factor 2
MDETNLKAKPKKARIQRILSKKEPQLIETTKKCIVMKGHHTSQTIVDALKDIAKLQKPNCTMLSRKNEVLPFEDANSIEFLSQKNDCSLFVMGSHSKKRPNNLVMVSHSISLFLIQQILHVVFAGSHFRWSHLRYVRIRCGPVSIH